MNESTTQTTQQQQPHNGNINNIQQLETYILSASNPSSNAIDSNTPVQILNSIQNTLPITTCVHLFQHSSHPQVQFYALGVIQRRIVRYTTSEERIAIRELLLDYGAATDSQPTFLKRKMGIVFALLIHKDFPETWPEAMDTVQNLVVCEHDVFYLYILNGIADEIGDVYTDREIFIKDVMRGFRTNGSAGGTTISARILETLLQLFSKYYTAGHTNKEMIHLTLSTIKRYLEWIEIGLLTHPHLLQTLFATWKEYTPAAEALLEIIRRGTTTDEQKFHYLRDDLHLFEHLQCIDWNREAVVLADIVNVVGLELLEMWENEDEALVSSISRSFRDFMPCSFACFSSEITSVSSGVLPLFSRFSMAIKKELQNHKKDGFSIASYLPTIFELIYIKMQYPAPQNFNFLDYEDEEEDEQLLYCEELYKLYIKFIQVATSPPSLATPVVYTFLSNVFTSLPNPISSAANPKLEAALRLLYHYGEGNKKANSDAAFQKLLWNLHRSDIAQHTSGGIVILYYDIVVRYSTSLLGEDTFLLLRVLDAMTGAQGILHPHPKVQSRSSYLLLRLCKNLKSYLDRNLVEMVIQGIHSLLLSDGLIPFVLENPNAIQNLQNLLETSGLFIGMTAHFTPQEQAHNLTVVLTPFVSSMQMELQGTSSIESLSLRINFITILSKGFTSANMSQEVQSVFLQTLHVCKAILQRFPTAVDVRNKIMILFHRFLTCLDSECILPHLSDVIRILVERDCKEEDDDAKQRDFGDVSRLLHQTCIVYRCRSIPIMDWCLVPYSQKFNELFSSTSREAESSPMQLVPPHLFMEQISLQKYFFSLLYHIAHYDAASAFYSVRNAESLSAVLRTMKHGWISSGDATIQKYCVVFFGDLIEQWGSDAIPEQIQSNFFEFVYTHLLSDVFLYLFSPRFRERDALFARNLREMGSMLHGLKTCDFVIGYNRGMLVVWANLSSYHVPCPEEVMTAGEGQDMEKCLKQWIQLKYENIDA